MIGRVICWIIIIGLFYFAYKYFVVGNSQLATRISSFFHSTAANITK